MEVSTLDLEDYNSFRKWANVLLTDVMDIQMSNNCPVEIFIAMFELRK